jgi:SPX domain protein involved in polyphosphate accumulation
MYFCIMKNLYLFLSLLAILSCNNSKENKEWNDNDKDTIYSECIQYAEIVKYDNQFASKYCDCLSNALFDKYENFDNYNNELLKNPGDIIAEIKYCEGID